LLPAIFLDMEHEADFVQKVAAQAPPPLPARSSGQRISLKQLMADYERSIILGALAAAGGNQRRAARALSVLPTTLCEKMKRLGIPGGGTRVWSGDSSLA
jgi:DNA-binding NtrC family response regulator